ncbi:MAG TPA: SPOR domain-containing protein [Pseudochrobactrum sp.]|nr:SPOR domain-containing protein [Pseudochrobactrum sp.]
MTDSSVTSRNQNHSDIRDESARDNDPLFELSRIFGFDERADQNNLQEPQAEPDLSSEISLERELMADFDAEFAAEFSVEPEHSDDAYQALQDEVQSPVRQAANESRYSQQPVEPRFTGYAPLQRAYAEPESPAEQVAEPQAAFAQEMPQYYAEAPDYTVAPEAAEQTHDAYYAAYSDLPQDAAFSEPLQAANEDYFSSLESELNQNFAADPAPQEPAVVYHNAADSEYDLSRQSNDAYAEPAGLNTDDFDFSDIGREPNQEFVAQTYDNVFAESEKYSPVSHVQPQADISLEDELAFLLHDEAPVEAPVQPSAYSYEEPAYTAAPAVYDEPAVSQTDFAPLFDAPASEIAPAVADFDGQEQVSHDVYAAADQAHDYSQAAPVADYDQIDDEFFAAPDLTHLPNRTAVAHSNWEEDNTDNADDAASGNSFADLFGAKSQPDFTNETEAASDYQPEVAASYEDELQTESFSFGDDFYKAEESYVAEEQVLTPEPAAPLAHNAVRGYSSYTFGAATPAAASADHVVSSYADVVTDAVTPASYNVAPVNEAESTAVSDNFFSNDDFDFSFDEDVQPSDDFAAVEEELSFELPEEPELPELPAYEPVQSFAPKSFVPAPEIESVTVSENKVEQTQALDLPDVSYGDDVKATGLNSLESEFAEIFSTISVSEAAPDSTSEADKAFENILQDNFADYHAPSKAEPEAADTGFGMAAGAAAGLAAAAVAGAATRSSATQTRTDAAGNASQDDYYNHWAAQGAQTNDFDTYNLSDNFARDEAEFENTRPREENPLRKPALWASVAVAALIVLGGGYYLLKSGGVVGGEPAILRADSQPVKMQPENPGGAVVPNQDKAVYDQVSGTKPASPEQKTLINTEEEPVDVGLLAGQDAEEDRLLSEEQNVTATPPAAVNNAAQSGERELVTPRTVRTMVVRADGTIVPGEAPAATTPANNNAAVTDTGLDEASRLISQSAVPERLGADAPAPSAQSAAAPRVVQTQSFTASGEQVKPREVTAAPVVPSRPAEQPVNVVGNVERPAQNQAQNQAQQQVASAVAPAANVSANVPAGTWFIQVASQPSAELAQKNYANLSSRYGNIIGGRGVDIKKADIAGKGTYYRVRIPGGTKAEAAALCERLKSAGGSCFPTL